MGIELMNEQTHQALLGLLRSLRSGKHTSVPHQDGNYRMFTIATVAIIPRISLFGSEC